MSTEVKAFRKVYVSSGELPNDAQSVIIGYDNDEQNRFTDIATYHKDTNRFQVRDEGYSQGRRNPDYWLKPLTETQFKEIK